MAADEDESQSADSRLRAQRAAEREEKQGSDDDAPADAPESDEGYGVRMLCARHARELGEQAHVEVEATFCDVCNADADDEADDESADESGPAPGPATDAAPGAATDTAPGGPPGA